jgi:hypothetical protein
MSDLTEGLDALYGDGNNDEKPDLSSNFESFVERLRREWRDGWPILIIIDGASTGVGKSTLGIHLCRRLDPKFDLDHFAFRGREIEPLYARLPPWSMIQVDEPRDLMGSKGTRDRELRHIAGALGSVRKNLVGTILISPKKEFFDSILTGGLAPYWLFLEERGVARVHRAWRGATYRKSQRLVPYDRTRINKIGFPALDGDPFYEAYVDLAVRRNREFYAEAANGHGRGGGQNENGRSENGTYRATRAAGPPPPLRPGVWACPRCGLRGGGAFTLARHAQSCPGGSPTPS